jgi:hypothetical protein
MRREHEDAMIRLLRQAIRPVEAADPPGDLWPRVRGRTSAVPPRPSTAEWIVLAVVTAFCLLRPATVSLLLFHF